MWYSREERELLSQERKGAIGYTVIGISTRACFDTGSTASPRIVALQVLASNEPATAAQQHLGRTCISGLALDAPTHFQLPHNYNQRLRQHRARDRACDPYLCHGGHTLLIPVRPTAGSDERLGLIRLQCY